jgi:uncharacterized lipoprotein
MKVNSIMTSYSKLFCISALTIILSACNHVYGDNGVIKNHDTDYLKAKNIAPMQVPAGLNKSSISSNYPVPDKVYPGSNPRVDLTPPGLAPAAPKNSSN